MEFLEPQSSQWYKKAYCIYTLMYTSFMATLMVYFFFYGNTNVYFKVFNHSIQVDNISNTIGVVMTVIQQSAQ